MSEFSNNGDGVMVMPQAVQRQQPKSTKAKHEQQREREQYQFALLYLMRNFDSQLCDNIYRATGGNLISFFDKSHFLIAEAIREHWIDTGEVMTRKAFIHWMQVRRLNNAEQARLEVAFNQLLFRAPMLESWLRNPMGGMLAAPPQRGDWRWLLDNLSEGYERTEFANAIRSIDTTNTAKVAVVEMICEQVKQGSLSIANAIREVRAL